MAFAASRNGLPLSEMNTTPLIDVMLVLLIMLIFTIPMATNSLDVDLPGDTPPPPFPVDETKNIVTVTADGHILWNGDTVNQPQFEAELAAATALRPEPELQFEPEAQASYDLSAKVLRAIKASRASRFGFVGNDRYRSFGKQD